MACLAKRPEPLPMSLWSLIALLAFVATPLARAQAIPNCAFIGPAYPVPTDFLSSDILKEAQRVSLNALSTAVKSGNFGIGQIDLNTTSFSVGVFSAESPGLLFEYHYAAPGNNGSLSSEELDSATIYRIGSITKLLTVYTFIAVLGMDYWEKPITDYVPELANVTADDPISHVNWHEVTLGALAGQLSGIARDYSLVDLSTMPSLAALSGFPPLPEAEQVKCGSPGLPLCTREESLRLLLSTHPIAATFHAPIYSNPAFQLLAMAYEQITHEDFDTAVKRVLLDPLGLRRTFWRPPSNDSNAVVVEQLDPSFARTWDYDLGIQGPAGNAYMSIGDMARLGTSILRSELLPPRTTREWLKPGALTGEPSEAVGKPWEITRMNLPVSASSNVTRLVDLYTKSGGIGAYSSVLVLSPDHSFGIAVLSASQTGSPSTIILQEALADIWIPAAEFMAREQAARNFAGRYVLDGTPNSTVNLAVRPDRSGIGVASFVYNSTDVLGLGSASVAVDLYLMQQTKTRAAFRTSTQTAGRSMPRSLTFIKSCIDIWATLDGTRYGNVGKDEVLFDLDSSGKATCLEVPITRIKNCWKRVQ